MLDQHRAPVWEALEEMRREKLVPFDVPGHKRGRGNKELMDFLGERCLSVDVNSTKYLDSLCHPTGILMEGEELAAEAFGASAAFFMVGGTTASIQAMIFFTSASVMSGSSFFCNPCLNAVHADALSTNGAGQFLCVTS